MTFRLPVLDSLRIAAPCSESWDRMTGNERVRNCATCRLDVYNLSAMTRADAEALLAARTGRMCARFYRRADGTVLTADCPVGVRQRRRRVLAIAALGGAASVAALAGVVNHLRPPGTEAPRARIELAAESISLAEREAQSEPQRVVRARPEMYIEPPPPVVEHWTAGVIEPLEPVMGVIDLPEPR